MAVECPGRFDIVKLGPMLEEFHTRLSGVVIESLSFDKFIPRYDRPGTLFYFDPPYFGNENDYGKELFRRDDFEVLAEILAHIQGRFILSLNDRPEVRSIFKQFEIEAVTTSYSIAPKSPTRGKVGELLISN